MAYFYFSNRATLSTIFARDLGQKQAVASYRRHIVAFAMAAISVRPSGVQPDG
jgi:TetR/AcrR family transcriptional regulator